MPETKGFKDGNTIYTYVDEVARGLANPPEGNPGDVLTRTETGTEWAPPQGGGGSVPFAVGVTVPFDALTSLNTQVEIPITSGAADINALSAAIDAGTVQIEAAITRGGQTLMTIACDQITDLNVNVASIKAAIGILAFSLGGDGDITAKITITVGSLAGDPGAVTAILSPLAASDSGGMPHDLFTDMFVEKVNGEMVLRGTAKAIFDTLSDLVRYQSGYADESVFDNFKLYETTASDNAHYRRRCYRLTELLYNEAVSAGEKEFNPIVRAVFTNVSADSDATVLTTLRKITLDFTFDSTADPYTVSADLSYSENVLSAQSA